MRVPLACALAAVIVVVETGRTQGAITFVDITAKAGITFVHNNGATGKKYMPETFGSGGVFLDINDDGWQDILLLNSTKFSKETGRSSYAALYRNRGDGTFADITRGSGLDVEMFGLAGAAADYDNDGRVDIYVTTLHGGRLFRNLGDGKFADVTKTAGVAASDWTTAAMWFDFNKDRFVDLVVGRYVEWRPDIDLHCTQDGKAKSYCTPESYAGLPLALFVNRGNGTFQDVSKTAGVAKHAKALGLAALDYDGDGWTDIFVANDMVPNNLYRNTGKGVLTDVASRAGVAVTEAGAARAGMGTDAADYDGSGRPSVIVGNFSTEMMALFRNDGRGLFIDEAPASGIGRASLLRLTFGCFFFDYDLDGRPDIFAANGHVQDDIERVQKRITYRQAPHLFRNNGGGKFIDAISSVGPHLARAVVARGAAYADIDNDGDLDVLMTTNNGPAYLFRNDGGNANNMLRVRTIGTAANHDGIGARVEVRLAGGRTHAQLVKTGSSYLSQSELPLTFGLGTAATVDGIRVIWPSGKLDTIGPTKANQVITVREGAGAIAATPIKRS
jgi:hypothetical protein